MAFISNTNNTTGGLNAKISPYAKNVTPAWKRVGSNLKIDQDGALYDKKAGAKVPVIPLGSVSTQTPTSTAPAYKGTSGVVQAPSTSSYTPPATSLSPTPQTTVAQTTTPKKTLGLTNKQEKAQSTKGLVTPGSFSSFVTGLQDSSKPSKEQQRYLRQLEESARLNQQIAQDARNTSQMYGSEIERIGQLGAGAVAGARSTGTDVVGRGNANIAAESASNRINSLSAALAAQLQGTGQQLTAAEQQTQGMTSALSGANTQQQQAINALAQGGGLVAPSPSAYGQTVFDPRTGQFTGAGGNLDPQNQAAQLAQQVVNKNMTYDQALASLSYAGQAGTNFLNNALTSAGANPLQLQAQGAAQQANVATQQTAGTDIARQGLATATQDYVSMNQAAEFANSQASAVSDILSKTGLNNVSSTDFNKALRNVQQRFSDTDRIALNTALQEAQIAYTNLLSSGGGTPTGSEAAALNTLNIDHSAAAINASIQQLEAAASRRLQAQYGSLQQYQQNLGSGATMGGSQGGSGGIFDW